MRPPRLGIAEGRCRFAGNQADVVPWLRAFDVFCLPSYANEGVPQALMQAMAYALPVIGPRPWAAHPTRSWKPARRAS